MKMVQESWANTEIFIEIFSLCIRQYTSLNNTLHQIHAHFSRTKLFTPVNILVLHTERILWQFIPHLV